MLYWKHKTESGTTLETELLSCKSAVRVDIASAFISKEGVRILQLLKDTYSLQKESITIYLSSQFSADEPHTILEQLSNLCVTKILFDHSFHPKVYLLRGNPTKIIFGSSNFTKGGMAGNIEFDFIGSPTTDDLKSITSFFNYCDYRAKVVDTEIIKYYKDNNTKIAALYHNQKQLSSVLAGFTHQDDAFLPEDYNLDRYYFDYDDYETFFTRNQKKNSADIKVKRELVRSKMLEIHKMIYTDIKKLGIAHHKKKENITSLIIPHRINHGSVAWLGVRYGKTPKEVDVLNTDKEIEDDMYGFQKHGCLQFSIGSDGFGINLFLAVRHGAIDRAYLHQNLTKLKPTIESELTKLKGHSMKWVIWDKDSSLTFDIDSEDPSAFCDFFRINDRDGCESYLRKYYEPDDVVLITKETIGDEILRVIKLLLPLYNTVVWRPPV